MEKLGSISHLDAAEVANATGNELYRAGNVEDAISAYTEALEASAIPPERNCDGQDGFTSTDRSKYYANRSVVEGERVGWVCRALYVCSSHAVLEEGSGVGWWDLAFDEIHTSKQYDMVDAPPFSDCTTCM